MKLNDFLTAKGTSMGQFAQTVGTTTATISRVVDGTVIPRRALMQRIYESTSGLVTPNDLYGLHCTAPCNANCMADANSNGKNHPHND